MADHPILKWWPVAATVIAGAIAYGKLESDVTNLKERVSGLENHVDPLRQLRVGRGDLCLKMLDQQGSVKDPKRQQQLQQQWDREGCEAIPVNATGKIIVGVPVNAVQNSE